MSASRFAALGRLGTLAAVVALALVVAWMAGLGKYRDPQALVRAVRGLRDAPFATLLFVLAYAVASALAVPITVMTLAGGVVFGFGLGALVSWVGALLGGVLGFVVARLLCSGECREVLGKRASGLEKLARTSGFLGTLRLRLVPVIPFGLVNYGAALAGVRMRDFTLATAIGILPTTLLYSYFADRLIAGVGGARDGVLLRLGIATVMLLALSFLPRLWQKKAT